MKSLVALLLCVLVAGDIAESLVAAPFGGLGVFGRGIFGGNGYPYGGFFGRGYGYGYPYRYGYDNGNGNGYDNGYDNGFGFP